MASSSSRCPTCGTDIPDGSPGDMCPKCLLQAGHPSSITLDLESVTVPSGTPGSTKASGLQSFPETIGPYRIISALGSGGMGQVFIAEQEQPIRRQVALKLVKPGMDSEEILARFAAERQAIALMDHAHIARIFDAGSTDQGRPYFVMELVEGLPITQFCDDHKLNLRQRLSLFAQVCRAVQHAHQKGILHRDIKPSNILVTQDTEDGDGPTPKIIDFGIAKALGAELANETAFTMAGQILGTPQYMSPEQASLASLDIDTRSDIYSLGVLLYELLTGRLPLEIDHLRQAGLDAILKIIREQDAPRPSTKLGSIDEKSLTSVANVRRLPTTRLIQSLKGDLDWIVMKALEKERSRRYETANALGDDIQRYLSDEPVLASPPSRAYLFQKFARRNKGTLTAASAILTALTAGILATTWQAHEARRAQASAEGLVSFMLHDLRTRLLDVGRLDVMSGVEDAVENYYAENPTRVTADESTSLRAQSLEASRETLKNQGRIDEAIKAAEAALKIRSKLRRLQPGDHPNLEAGAENLFWLNWLHLELIQPIPARHYAKDGIEWLSAIPSTSLSEEARGNQVKLLCQQAEDTFIRLHDRDTSQKLILRAAEIAFPWLEKSPDSQEAQAAVIAVRTHATEASIELPEHSEMTARLGPVSEMMARLVEANPESFETKRLALRSLNAGASISDEASLKRAVDLARSLTAHDPENFEWQKAAAAMEAQAGLLIMEADRYDEGLNFYLDSIHRFNHWEDEHRPLPPATRLIQATTMSRYGRVMAERQSIGGRPDSTILRYVTDPIEVFRQAVAADSSNVHHHTALGWALYFDEQSRYSLAETQIPPNERVALLEEALRHAEFPLLRTGLHTEHLDYICWTLTTAYLGAGKVAEAREIADLAVERNPERTKHRSRSLNHRAAVALAEEDIESARNCFAEAIGIERSLSEQTLKEGYTYRDLSYYARQLAQSALGLSKLLNSPSDPLFPLVENQTDHIESAYSQMHPDQVQADQALKSAVALHTSLASLYWEAEDRNAFRTQAARIPALCLKVLDRIPPGASHRHLILHHLVSATRKLATIEGIPVHEHCLLTESQAETLHRLWQSSQLQASTDPNADLANWIPWMVCRTLATRHPEEATRWLQTALDWLNESWSACHQAGTSSTALRQSLTCLVAALNDENEAIPIHPPNERQRLRRLAVEQRILWEIPNRPKDPASSTAARVALAEQLQRTAQEEFNTPEHRTQAIEIWTRVEDISRALLEDGHYSELPRLVRSLFDQGLHHHSLGHLAEAVACMERLVQLESQTIPQEIEKLDASTRGLLAQANHILAVNYRNLAMHDAQEAALRRGIRWWDQPNVTSAGEPAPLKGMRCRWQILRLFEDTQRLQEPEVRQWCQEIVETANAHADSPFLKGEFAKCQPAAQRILQKLDPPDPPQSPPLE